jgi:hypothetical protein
MLVAAEDEKKARQLRCRAFSILRLGALDALALGPPLLARLLALFASQLAVAVGIGPVETLKRRGRSLLHRHAAVAVGVGKLEHPSAETGHPATCAGAASVGTAIAVLVAGGNALLALGTSRIELRSSDLAVAVGVEALEQARSPLSCASGLGRPSGRAFCANRVGLGACDHAVTVGVEEYEQRAGIAVGALGGTVGALC